MTWLYTTTSFNDVVRSLVTPRLFLSITQRIDGWNNFNMWNCIPGLKLLLLCVLLVVLESSTRRWNYSELKLKKEKKKCHKCHELWASLIHSRLIHYKDVVPAFPWKYSNFLDFCPGSIFLTTSSVAMSETPKCFLFFWQGREWELLKK